MSDQAQVNERPDKGPETGRSGREDGNGLDTLERLRSAGVEAITRLGGPGGALVILLALVVAFWIASPDFMSRANLVNILQQYSVVGILAIAQTVVIISAGIDLSVAATAALSGSVMAVSYAHWGLPEPVAWLLGIGAGFLVGAFNGFVITKWDVPDIIATLGTFTGVRGVALLVTNGLPVPSFDQVVKGRDVPQSIIYLGSGKLFGVPVLVIIAAIFAVIGWFILRHTTRGRAVFAVGGNREAAHASGISVDKTKFFVYAVAALFSAFAGFLLTGRLSSANALMGSGMMLQSIAAVVVGGTNLFGGEGSVRGTVVGILIIGVLANGLTIMGVSEFWQRVMNGLIIVVVVALDQWRRRIAQEQSKREAVAT